MALQLNICTFEEPPIIHIELIENELTFRSGIYSELYHLMTNNMSVKILLSPAQGRGHYANGSWTGCMGMLHRKEADLGMFPYFPSADSMEIVDNSKAFMYTYTTIVSGRRCIPAIDDTFAFTVFSFEVWIAIGISVVLVSILKTSIEKLFKRSSPRAKDASALFLIDCFWESFSIGNLSAKQFRRTHSKVVLVVTWLMAYLFLNCIYKSNFQATLSDVNSNVIETLEDVARQQRLKPFIRKEGFYSSFFSKGNDPTLKKIWKRISTLGTDQSWQDLQSNDTWREIKSGRGVQIFDRIPLTHYLSRFCQMDDPMYHFAVHPVMWHPTTFALRKGLSKSFVRKLNTLFMLYASGQLFERHFRVIRRQIERCLWQPSKSETEQISIEYLELTFQLLFAGVVLSTVVFILELRIVRYVNITTFRNNYSWK